MGKKKKDGSRRCKTKKCHSEGGRGSSDELLRGKLSKIISGMASPEAD